MSEKSLQLENIKIYCKHCKKELPSVWIVKFESIIGTRYALLCTDCQKLIGIRSSMDFIEPIIVSDNFLMRYKSN